MRVLAQPLMVRAATMGRASNGLKGQAARQAKPLKPALRESQPPAPLQSLPQIAPAGVSSGPSTRAGAR
jgi:hypothetical protein